MGDDKELRIVEKVILYIRNGGIGGDIEERQEGYDAEDDEDDRRNFIAPGGDAVQDAIPEFLIAVLPAGSESVVIVPSQPMPMGPTAEAINIRAATSSPKIIAVKTSFPSIPPASPKAIAVGITEAA